MTTWSGCGGSGGGRGGASLGGKGGGLLARLSSTSSSDDDELSSVFKKICDEHKKFINLILKHWIKKNIYK